MNQTESLVWVLYDIVSDRKRARTAKACKGAGLYRVQKSVFLGTIQNNRLDELAMQIQELIDEDRDRVYIFPMCEPDFRKVIVQGQGIDMKLVRGDLQSMFL